MMDTNSIEYIGEHAWAGMLGHVLTALSLVGAAVATLGYFLGAQRKQVQWSALGRMGFRMHSAAVLGIVVVLFTMLFNHWFEYNYVWKHSNLQMPLKYIASCFWEGQEGSFLLWTFWHMVLGNILIWRFRRRASTTAEWEPYVMAVIALVQVFLAFMLLGIYVGDTKLGSSPFLLMREIESNIGLPWTMIPDYLARIPQLADGEGLNPLLQNYWMVIHPPTLFLGFAATLVPFAFAISGLWRGQRTQWIAPALPWTFFGVMVLGTGILMGGAWAYEALSFGGFWAWDPVENASLVPWITLVAAGHLMLVNKRKETSLFAAYLLTLITFILVLYSTFLTRSGVLGDTSVHSFTGDGMLPALVRFLLIFIGISAALMHPDRAQRRFYVLVSLALLVIGVVLEVEVPAILLFGLLTIVHLAQSYRQGFMDSSPEESAWSREFWIFIGSLILLLSAAQITFSTSIPVFNLLLEPFERLFAWIGRQTGSSFFTNLGDIDIAPPAKPKPHYNKFQVPLSMIVAFLVAFTQYLRWRTSDFGQFMRKLAVPLVLSIILAVVLTLALGYSWREFTLVALLFTTCFAAIANIAYVPLVLKGSLKNAGPSIAHTGFALVLLGALVSTSRSDAVSSNARNMDLRYLSEEFSNSEDILLYRGDTVRMGDHYVHYESKRHDGVNLHYEMDYFAVRPRTYHAGDTVRIGGALFRARDDHQAGADFLAQQPDHWEELRSYSKRELWHAREWTPTAPGDSLFTLAPFVQLNKKFGNVAEPSTKHWPGRDLYTHIRYADLAIDPDTLADGSITPDDRWMPDRLHEKQVGDTIVTPTSVVIIDSVYTVSDSATKAMLGEQYTVYAALLRIRDLYNPERWFEARPLVIYAHGQPVAGRAAEVAPLRIKYGLATVDGEKLGINVAEAEFVVMHAIVFPGINILWIGCILLALGTGLAVWQRIKGAKAPPPLPHA
ncbi:MAG: cytochrome c biogenesis protein CcsA [Flavobacteriales bacterium]|nr:cytochrome c biogenesis protein CcsA [Flavobacteriales bacterium]